MALEFSLVGNFLNSLATGTDGKRGEGKYWQGGIVADESGAGYCVPRQSNKGIVVQDGLLRWRVNLASVSYPLDGPSSAPPTLATVY